MLWPKTGLVFRSSSYFTDAWYVPPGIDRHTLPDKMIAKIHAELRKNLGGKFCTLAIDGGTSVRRAKIVHCCALVDGQAYWVSATTVVHGDSKTLVPIISASIDHLRADWGLKVLGVVADNHSAYQVNSSHSSQSSPCPGKQNNSFVLIATGKGKDPEIQ